MNIHFLENNRNQISLIFVLIYIVISLILILLSTFIGLKFAERIVSTFIKCNKSYK